jgi:hypothetical protein
MLDFDFTRFESALEAAAATAFCAIRKKHSKKSFYAYALYTTGLFNWICPACNADREPPGSPGDWVVEGWAFLSRGDKAFAEVNRMLSGMGGALSELPRREFEVAIHKLTNCTLRVLKTLDCRGVFGKPGERADYVLNRMLDDQDHASILETARKVNPPAVVRRLAKELKGQLRAPTTDRTEPAPKTGDKPARREKAGRGYVFHVMEHDYDKRGNSPWHSLAYRPVLAAFHALQARAPLASTWKPLNAMLRREKAAPDIYASSETVVNGKALAVFRPFLEDQWEALPLNLPKNARDVGPLHVLHALRADVPFGTPRNRPEECSFRRQDLAGRHFFRAYIWTFVSTELRRAVEEAGLQGVAFSTPKFKLRR